MTKMFFFFFSSENVSPSFFYYLQTTVFSSEVNSDQVKIELMLTNKVFGPESKALSHEARI